MVMDAVLLGHPCGAKGPPGLSLAVANGVPGTEQGVLHVQGM